MSAYWVGATNTPLARYGEIEAADEADGIEKARTMSTDYPGVSFGLYDVQPGRNYLIASFLNGERKFEATP